MFFRKNIYIFNYGNFCNRKPSIDVSTILVYVHKEDILKKLFFHFQIFHIEYFTKYNKGIYLYTACLLIMARNSNYIKEVAKKSFLLNGRARPYPGKV